MKIIYIIPGYGENCSLLRYKKLIQTLENKGYVVVPINPDWFQPISKQTFKIKKNSILFGFSYGAILAYLIAREYESGLLILGSLSPIHTFSLATLIKDNLGYMSKELAIAQAKDIKSIKIDLNIPHIIPYISLAGELEDNVIKSGADILIPNTNHYLSKNYINAICKIL